MEVYFCNNGELDLDLVRIMGVSVKVGNNPIGYFGTGLKYAIATLLRGGHKIKIETGGKVYNFDKIEKEIRGQKTSLIQMQNVTEGTVETLGYSLELGKNWECWQAFRELYSNTKDEGGVVSDEPQEGFDTCITVEGKGIADAYEDRHNIFLIDREPIFKDDTIEIYEGRSEHLYYRGVRVYDLPDDATYTYNLLKGVKLTEDRTLSSEYTAREIIEKSILNCGNQDILESILYLEGEGWELNFDYDYSDYQYNKPNFFIEFIKNNKNDLRINNQALALYQKLTKKTIFDDAIPFSELTEGQKKKLQKAMMICQNILGCDEYKGMGCINIVKDLEGASAVYSSRNNQIYIDLSLINSSIESLVMGLYEEYNHKFKGFNDRDIRYQYYLLNKIASMAVDKYLMEG